MRRFKLANFTCLAFLSAWTVSAAQDKVPLGIIKGPSVEQAKATALEWLMGSKPSEDALERFEAIWAESSDVALLERVAGTLSLGDADAKSLIEKARDNTALPPLAVPDLVKDTTKPNFYRANLGLYYAKQLSARRIHEQALEVLRSIRPEHVVDPGAYYFYKAVAEHELLLKADGLQSANRLLQSVPDAPERYRVVAELIKHDMEQWKDEDLGHVSRLMDSIERRLDLAQGGPKTQDQQKEVIALLDKMIKKMEEQQQQQQASSGQGGGQQPQPGNPLQESRITQGQGPGRVRDKRLDKLADLWGNLPEKEKTQAQQQISRDYPPHYREAIEEYLRRASRGRE